MRTSSSAALAVSALILAGCQSTGAGAGSADGTIGADLRPAAYPTAGRVVRLAPALGALVGDDAAIEVLAGGFGWSEGPVWRKSGGYLLFTDVPGNTVHRWKEGEGASVFLRPAGYAVAPGPWAGQGGSNGLLFDAQDRLILADHGNRMVARLDEKTSVKTPLATHYQGKRLNSPNDLALSSRGDLYFTDPPYGLQGGMESPQKELDFSGVYRLDASGELTLVDRELRYPNGVALSPDERTLYVSNSDPQRAIIKAYDVRPDGSVANGRILFDATPMVGAERPGLPDGLAIDQRGNLFATGPGGVLVIAPDGTHLGTIATGKATANVKFGDDGSTLYMTAHDSLMRIRTRTRGAGF